MKNILFLQTKLIIDGPGIVVKNIIEHLDRSLFIPIVGCMYKGGDLEKWYREKKIKTVNFNMRGPLRGWLDIFALRRINRFLKDEKIDLVHTHLIRADIYGRLASALSRVPVITTIHNTESHHMSKKVFDSVVRYLDKKTIGYCDKIIVVSEALRQFLCHLYRIPESNIAVVHNGIEIQDKTEAVNKKKLEITENGTVVCTVARLHEQKGIQVLVRAIDTIAKKGFKVSAIIVGDGPLKYEISDLVRSLNAPVVLAGFRHDVTPFICAADIFVLPSLWEGFGLVLIEAMSFSKPVIATKVGGIPEIVPDGIVGTICNPNDSESLADAIITLIKNPALGEKMGRAGRERVEKFFTAQIMSARYQEIYRNILRI